MQSTASTTAGFSKPNSEGIYEEFEQVSVTRMPPGCAAQFQIANTREGYRVGFWLHSRQPKNTSSQPASVSSPLFEDRAAALKWLVEEIALKFFSDSRGACLRLKAWSAELVFCALPVDPAPAESSADDAPAPVPSIAYDSVPLGSIERNPGNKRREFNVDELAESIRSLGILLQPIALRDLGADANPRYRLIAGERRLRAHQKLGRTHIDARIFANMTDELARELALVENLQRENLNPMEEAEEVGELRYSFGYSTEKIADRIGKSVDAVDRALRLLKLPPQAQDLIRRGAISAAHGSALRGGLWAAVPEDVLLASVEKLGVSASGLGRNRSPVDVRLLRALSEGGHVIEIGSSAYSYDDIDPQVTHADDGTVWHTNVSAWNSHVEACRAAERAKARQERDRLSGKVATGIEAGVNVKVSDLVGGRRPYVIIRDDLSRYARYIPESQQCMAIDDAGAEVLVCLVPEKLKALRKREAEAIARDRASHFEAIVSAAEKKLQTDQYLAAKASAATAMLDAFGSGVVDVPLLERDEAARSSLLSSLSAEVFAD